MTHYVTKLRLKNYPVPYTRTDQDPSLVAFIILILCTIGALYYTPPIIATLFSIITLIAYFKSKHEAFWLAYFLTIGDGFFGFFGNYEAILTIVPGMPGVEVGQIYVLLTVIKTLQFQKEYRPFYSTFLNILFVYLIFLVIQGYIVGLSWDMNVQFRIIKYVLPFAGARSCIYMYNQNI